MKRTICWSKKMRNTRRNPNVVIPAHAGIQIKSGPRRAPGGHTDQSGNALFLVLLGVILFAALIFVFSRGMDTGATRMTSAEARTMASDAINYAQAMERVINRMIQNGISEEDISFENNIVSGYAHTPAAGDAAQVFNTATGGGMDFATPMADQTRSPSVWLVTGGVVVTGQEDDSNSELLLTLPVTYDICIEMNKQLNTGIDITDDQGTVTGAKFTGTYTDSALVFITPGAGQASGCVKGLIDDGGQSGDYTFYTVLIAR
jgi:hypothetical protein